MRQKLNIITLGVSNLERTLDFYEKGLGWKKSKSSQGNIAFFQMGGIVLAFYPREMLAEDAKLSPEGSGFAGITIAYNTKTEAEVDEVMKEVKGLGAEIVKAPEKVFWGGYSGYFKDLDGHLFEVAYSPFAEFDDLDQLVM
ncbi:VOC family protein [Portibacter lacus]|uniref:Glyoxalase n=1 Tax=Portibacter lacus TaxID=1099794 RepID=A0AA37WGK6_9BACT|nr:VOC family protein [Portibacter lacus]GLR19948.1 glyoxalase [Portibacter lacus]